MQPEDDERYTRKPVKILSMAMEIFMADIYNFHVTKRRMDVMI
jgi:hypothetical protein